MNKMSSEKRIAGGSGGGVVKKNERNSNRA
jgi:hypothetical protein